MAVSFGGDSEKQQYMRELLRLCGCVPAAGWTQATMGIDNANEGLSVVTVSLIIPNGALEQAAYAMVDLNERGKRPIQIEEVKL